MPEKKRITSLVRLAQDGDELSFAELVNAYQDIAVAYATSILEDYHLAEDAAQEAFVEAHRELPSLREPAAFAAWFRTIIFKHCDRITRRKRHTLTDLEAALEVASPAASAQESLEWQETRISVWKAIAALSETERAVVLLYYMGEHSHAVISEFLNVTANTVKTRLYAARKRLRKQMEQIEENLNAVRPSNNTKFAEKVRRLIQPDVLKKNEPLEWSTGMGADVWEMFCAAINGDLNTIKRLLDKDPSLIRCQHHGRGPMFFAVGENRIEVVAFLLERGANPMFDGGDDSLPDIARYRRYPELQKLLEDKLASAHSVSAKGDTISAAIRARDLSQVQSLLDSSPEFLSAADKSGNQPIHWAVMTRQIYMIDELLARGADINTQRFDGAHPIQLCNGYYNFRGWRDVPKDNTTTPREVLTHLRKCGAYVDICTAAHIGDMERVQELLNQDPTLANRPSDYITYYACSGTPLRNAAGGGYIEIVKLLLEHGADPNLAEEGIAPRGGALYSAVYNGHFEIAKLLLENGAYPNPPFESSADALTMAMEHSEHMVELLCSYGASRSMDILAYYGDVKTAAAVFAANHALADNPQALEVAAENGNEGFVRLMLRYQPDLAKRAACDAMTRELAEMLFRHGMNPSQPDWLHITPLHRFAKRGDLEKAAVYIDNGANLHARDEEICSTPLGWAARYGKTLMVEFLLRRGAKLNLPDDPPWATPLAWATLHRHERIVQILKQFEEDGLLPAPISLTQYDSMANDLVAAYNSADSQSLKSIVNYFQIYHMENHEQLRRQVQQRLGKRRASENDGSELSLEEAQSLIARLHGFKSWTEVLKQSEK